MGKGFVEGNASGVGCRCGVAGNQGMSKKKPDGFDKRVWLQTRRIRSSRRANCKASASIINVAKKYVKNELKTLASVQLGEGNQDWSFSRNSRAGILPVPTMDRQDETLSKWPLRFLAQGRRRVTWMRLISGGSSTAPYQPRIFPSRISGFRTV